MPRRLKRFLVYGVILFVAGLFLIYSSLNTEEQLEPLLYFTTGTEPHSISAYAWIVFDGDTGEVLYAHNEDEILPIASVTKLATAAAIVRAHDLDATTTITWGDVVAEGQAGRLSPGEVYTYRDLLFPLLLESSNDAAEVFTREDPLLIERMKNIATEMHLTKTSFADASGLDDRNTSTASEVATLLLKVSVAHPFLIDITSVPSYINHKNGWMNNNPFIEYESYRGGKHGYTYGANRTFAGFFQETFQATHVRKIGYVLLGSDDLRSDIDILRDFTVEHTRIR